MGGAQEPESYVILNSTPVFSKGFVPKYPDTGPYSLRRVPFLRDRPRDLPQPFRKNIPGVALSSPQSVHLRPYESWARLLLCEEGHSAE